MSKFYKKMQKTSTKLLNKSDQGGMFYCYNEPDSGPAYDPIPGAAVEIPIAGTASGVSFKYIREGHIEGSDSQVITPVFEVTPDSSGTIKIRGRKHQIIEIKRIPEAGEVVISWIIFVKS